MIGQIKKKMVHQMYVTEKHTHWFACINVKAGIRALQSRSPKQSTGLVNCWMLYGDI